MAGNLSPPSALPPGPSAADRLDSWKDIARHLKRDVRTVQRWEKEYALPVRRHVNAKRGSVFAYKEEVDRWWNAREGELEEQGVRSAPGRFSRSYRGLAVSVATGVTIAVAAVGWWALKPAPPAPSVDSLVVLPLKNLSGDAAQEYFVEGMHEAIIGELARIGVLRVISRTSAMRYQQTNKSVQEIGQELDVDAVLEGSMLRVGSRVRIDLQLIDRVADRHLWADTYERELDDVLALQAEIARAVARRLATTLSTADRERLERAALEKRPRPNPDAYDAYLKGRYHFARWGQEPSETANQYYEEAIAKDPTFARAHAALAESLRTTGGLSGKSERLVSAAERAVNLDPVLPEAHTAMGLARMEQWDWGGSERAFERAIALDPNSSTAYQWYAELLRRYPSRREDALKAARRAEELDPLSLPVRTMVGWMLAYQRRYTDAIDVWRKVLELDPDYGLAIYNQGWVYAQMGRGEDVIAAAQRAAPRWRGARGEIMTTQLLGVGYALSGQRQEAEAILRQLQARKPKVASGPIAILQVKLGDKEQALETLERGYVLRDASVPAVTSGPDFDGLRDDGRFRALRAKIGLP